jgi:hypothetical protein
MGPDSVKPIPVKVAPLTVTAALPVDVKVTGWVTGVLITTSPNATLVALMVNARMAAFS